MNRVAVASPNFNQRPAGVDVRWIVLHADAAGDAKASISWIKSKESKVSYHALVDRDGTVYVFVDPSQRAWHAGKSILDGIADANNFTLGLSFANKCDGKEPYTDAQYDAGAEVVREWMALYPSLAVERMASHQEIRAAWLAKHPASAEVKHDPGPLFDLVRFQSLCYPVPTA